MEKYVWGHNRRFNSYPEYMRGLYGSRVQKLSLDAGFTCPNRDGTKGTGGCTFCNNDAFNPSYCRSEKSITMQLRKGKEFYRRRYRSVHKYLAYFQAYTNTYGDLERLKVLYGEALAEPGIIGMVIGTRPDCVGDELLDYLQELSENYFIVVEYGIESLNDHTLLRVKREHTVQDSLLAIDATARRGIRQGVHFILGLPGESENDMLEEMRMISELPVDQIKLHQLQVVKGTEMAEEYLNKPEDFNIYTLDEFLDLAVRIIEILNPRLIIERIAGESNPGYLLSPSWNMRYDSVLRKFEEKLELYDTWQGRRYGESK